MQKNTTSTSPNRCGRCGHVNPAAATVCAACVSPLKAAAPAKAAAPKPAPAASAPPNPAAPPAAVPGSLPSAPLSAGQTRFCPQCRGRVAATDLKCPHCNRVLQAAVRGPKLSLEQQQRRVSGFLLGSLGLGAAGVAYVMFNYGGMLRHRFLGQSDVRYTVETRVKQGDRPGLNTISRSQFLYSKGLRRIDTHYLNADFPYDSTRIDNCRDQSTYTVNEDLLIYIREPLVPGNGSGSDDALRFSRRPAGVSSGTTMRHDSRWARAGSPARAARVLTPVPGCRTGCGSMEPIAVLPVQFDPDAANGRGSTGLIKWTYTVEKLGQDTIADVKTIHYRLRARAEKSGCAGTSDETQQMEIWVAPGIWTEFACPNPTPSPTPAATPQPQATEAEPAPPSAMPTPHPVPDSYYGAAEPTPTSTPTPPPPPVAAGRNTARGGGCDIRYEQEGDSGSFASAFHGLVMRMRVYTGSEVTFEQEVTALEQKELLGEQFSVHDYKLVPEDEYRRRTFQLMVKKATENAAKRETQP